MDLMEAKLPSGETIETFTETLSDQVNRPFIDVIGSLLRLWLAS